MSADKFLTDLPDSLSDEELAALAQNGCVEAEERLILKSKQTVRRTARRYFLTAGDADDLIQEGMIGVLKAIRAFDTGKGSFSAFAAACAENQVISAVKKNCAKKRSDAGAVISDAESDDNGESDSEISNPETILINRESADELFRQMENSLSKMEYRIFCKYLDGYSYSEISEQTATSVKSVDNALSRIRIKIRQKLKDVFDKGV